MNQIDQLVQRRQQAKNSVPLELYQNEIAASARDEKMTDKRADKLLDTVEELAVLFPHADFKPANIAADAQAHAAYNLHLSQLDGSDAKYDAAQQTRIEVSKQIQQLEEQLAALKSKRAIADHETRAIAGLRNAVDRIRRQNPRAFWHASELADERAVRAAYGRI